MAIFTTIGLAALISIFLNVQHDILFSGATNYWYSILFMGYQYYHLLKYVPLVIGLSVGIAQYFPETINKRIKLSFHLPINENKMLIGMMLCGSVSLFVSFGLMFSMFWMGSLHYFPQEIVDAAIPSVIPWFLSGYAIYYFIAFIVLEPVWRYWIPYALVAYGFIAQYLLSSGAGGYEPVNMKFFILTAFLSLSLLFSANRFRKGEM